MPGSTCYASTKARAIWLVREHAGDYPTQRAAIAAVSGRRLWPGFTSGVKMAADLRNLWTRRWDMGAAEPSRHPGAQELPVSTSREATSDVETGEGP